MRSKGALMAVAVIAVMMAVPLFSSADASAEGSGDRAEEVMVWFIVTSGAWTYQPPMAVYVTDFDMDDYGINMYMIDGINGEHVFLKAHEMVFGKEGIADTMTVTAGGWLYKFWDMKDGTEYGMITYTKNGYMTQLANLTPTKEGDIWWVNFSGGSLTPAGSGTSFKEIKHTATTGTPVYLELSYRLVRPIYLYKENGTDEYLGDTDYNGRITLTFNEPGTYWVRCGTLGWTQITVRDVFVSDVDVDRTSASLLIGETLSLSSTVYPANADDKSVIWMSSRKNVASVGSDGTVTALSQGRTVITATTVDGQFVSSCEVTVKRDNSGRIIEAVDNTVLFAGIAIIGIIAFAIIRFAYLRR